MSWHGIHAHDQIAEQFRRALARGKLASSFLFVGPPGVGKRTFAMKLAQALLCETRPEGLLDPCATCQACQQVLAGTHPDLHLVAKPKDKSTIPIKLLIGEDETRMREGLCHDMALKPFRGGRRIAIIDDADYLAAEGANCLLKTLEEPPPRSVMILIGTSPQQQLPTIRSRCQLVRFHALPDEVVARLLLEHGIVSDVREAGEAAALGRGSLAQAAQFADPELREIRGRLLTQLSAWETPSFEFVKTANAFVDAAGKEAPLRRARMRQLAALAADFYRDLMREQCGLQSVADEILQRAVGAARKSGRGDSETAATALSRCLEAESQVDSNANQATLLECWFDDLAALAK
jgi:DNA polymerase-3 subunit delta'